MFEGHDTKDGSWLSITVTENPQILELPFASVAVNEIFVTPTGNEDPLGKPVVCANVSPGQLSVAVGATQLTTDEHKPGVQFTIILMGHEVNIGTWLSATVIVNEHILVLP
jgi:hypothetical protein